MQRAACFTRCPTEIMVQESTPKSCDISHDILLQRLEFLHLLWNDSFKSTLSTDIMWRQWSNTGSYGVPTLFQMCMSVFINTISQWYTANFGDKYKLLSSVGPSNLNSQVHGGLIVLWSIKSGLRNPVETSCLLRNCQWQSVLGKWTSSLLHKSWGGGWDAELRHSQGAAQAGHPDNKAEYRLTLGTVNQWELQLYPCSSALLLCSRRD